MSDPLRPSEKVIQLERYHQRHGLHVERTISPKDAYKADLSAANAKISEASQAYNRAESVVVGNDGNVSFNAYFKDLKRAMADMDQLESRKSTVRQEECEYQQRLEREQEEALRDHLTILGPSLSNKVFTAWFSAQQSPPTPTEDQVASMEDQVTFMEDQVTSMEDPATSAARNQYADITTHTGYTPGPADAQQPPAAALPTSNDPPVADRARDPYSFMSERQILYEGTTGVGTRKQIKSPGTKSLKVKGRARSKRRPQPKRRPRPKIPPEPLTDRSIEFSQVYQDGNAIDKYVMAKYGNHWYIVKCEEHQLEFTTKKPLLGAIKHLRGQEHSPGGGDTDIQMAIRKFGTRVKNCKEHLVPLNNSLAIRRASYGKTGVPQGSVQTYPDLVEDTDDDAPLTRNTNRTSAPPINPQPGEVYKRYWGNEDCYYAVLILPRTGTFDQAGIEGSEISIKDTALVEDLKLIPPCYKYNKGSGILEWAEGYGPGGPKASRTQYPVIYFDKPDPRDCQYGWVPASELETYNRGDSSVELWEQADEFLSERGSSQLSDTIYEQDQATNGDDVAEPTAVASGSETLHDRPATLHHSSPAAEPSGSSMDDSIVISDTESEFEIQTRESSVRLKEETVQTSLMDPPGVPLHNSEVRAPEQAATPDQREESGRASDDGPSHEQQNDHMDVDTEAGTVNSNTMTALKEGISDKKHQALLDIKSSFTTTPRYIHTDQQLDDVSMSDNTRASPIHTHVSVSPSSAAAQARAVLEHVLAGHSSTPEATPRKHYPPNHASQSPLPNRPEPYNVERDADHDSLANGTRTHTDQFEVSQSTSVAQRTLHNLCYRLNGLSTIGEHGELQEPHRSDGGTMWTSAETPDGTPTRVSQSFYPRHRRRKRRPVSCFIPRRR
ncbi:hypothetical protein FLAG1_09252 [Fusarium langsethiae]|uniref:Uncharacterized protein n=1 Tax=Fusarium langsethiae TaxID=179993 RepID=A0A0N0DC98_FUSLA|nr:hypothetical protein FLAG1_09252 [Fusarium langsethiae]GKU06339.1 unnamed protein product [Fusarium langsethiae]GKU21389.1 unnamed protein product [Fusarium langsethiae]